jgi:predicted MFS family arabinose efflux permease
MLRHDPRPIESWRGLVAVLCAKRVSVAELTILAFIVGGLMDTRSLTAGQAGMVTSVELTFSALAVTVTSIYLTRLPLYRITVLGIVTVALTQLLSATTVHFPSFLLLRIICGCAAGVVGAAVTSTIATAKNPDRSTGMILVAGGISGMLIMLPIAWANVHWRLSGVFTMVSLYCWITLLVIRWIPVAKPEPRATATSESRSRWKGKALAIPVLLGYVLWGTAEGALSAFTERFGKSIDLDQAQIGMALSLCPIALLCGGGLCVILGSRFGRTLPLSISILALGLTIGSLPSVETLTGFSTVLLVWTFFSTFSVPYVYGISASLDEHGRWVGLLAAASPIATGLGPLLGGLAMQSRGFGVLATWVALSYAIVFALIVPVSIRVPVMQPAPQSAGPKT